MDPSVPIIVGQAMEMQHPFLVPAKAIVGAGFAVVQTGFARDPVTVVVAGSMRKYTVLPAVVVLV